MTIAAPVPAYHQFFACIRGVIVRPRATFHSLAREPTVRFAVMLAGLNLLLGWGNMLLHAATGFDWLGTRANLPDPVYVGGMGYWQAPLAGWVPIFAALEPVLALLGLTLLPGAAHLIAKLWRGQGTFEGTVTALAFAVGVPALLIGQASEWLFGVPMDLIAGHPYFWTAAMAGDFGPVVAAVWNAYVIGVYSIVQYGAMVVLGAVAIRTVQKIPAWAAAVTMLVSFAAWMLVVSTFVR